MDAHTTAIFAVFERFLMGTLDCAAFAQWVYHTDTLGSVVGDMWETRLLAFDYQQPDADHSLHQLLRHITQDLRPGAETEFFWRLDVTAAARAFLTPSTDLFDTAGRICALCATRQEDCWHDLDFFVFCFVADQADWLLPPDDPAQLSPDERARRAQELADFEAEYDAVGECTFRLVRAPRTLTSVWLRAGFHPTRRSRA